MEWAKVLNCQQPVRSEEGVDCCDRCRSCRLIRTDRLSCEQNHPSFLLVDGLLCAYWEEAGKGKTALPDPFAHLRAKDSITVESIRMLHEFVLQASPFPWKVAVVDEAERLTPEASAALLKVLEETPERTVFFLISSNASALAPTVRSRCLSAPLLLVPRPEIVKALKGRGLSEEDANLLASLARGRVGWALSQLHDPDFKSRLISWSLQVSEVLTMSRWDIFRFAEKWAGEEMEETFADEETVAKRRALERRLLGLLLFFRDLLCLKYRADDLVVNPLWREAAGAGRWTPDRLEEALLHIIRTVRQIRPPWNANAVLALELLGGRLTGVAGADGTDWHQNERERRS